MPRVRENLEPRNDVPIITRMDPDLQGRLDAAVASAGPEWNRTRAVRTAIRLVLAVGLPAAEQAVASGKVRLAKT